MQPTDQSDEAWECRKPLNLINKEETMTGSGVEDVGVNLDTYRRFVTAG
jgi:hypothetical protein